MDADGANTTNLTNNIAVDEEPSWSLDGTEITFVSYHDGDADICLIRADGANVANLTNSSVNESRPAWGAAPWPRREIVGDTPRVARVW